MNTIDLDRRLLDAVAEAMREPEETPALHIERTQDWLLRVSLDLPMRARIDFIVSQLDELMATASNSQTVDLVDSERVAVGQVITRAQLLGSFLMARQPTALRIVQNG